jgi:S-adenosylmethionine synthetase
MTNTFKNSPCYLLTSESVAEGHPDKLCDQVSDAILDAILEQDPAARVACETAVTNGLVIIMGEISTSCYVDVARIARSVIKDIGYVNPEYGFHHETCGVIVSINEQSPDIAMGVNASKEAKEAVEHDDFDRIGAGDQGMMVGYACNETPEMMPLSIALSHRLCRRLSVVRKESRLPYLRPDGKSQVTVEYSNGIPKRIDSVVIGAQHDPGISREQLTEDIRREVIDQVIPAGMTDSCTRYLVNATGRFVIDGPVSDTGFTGRKIIVDTYGGIARHGGGAFSGKDPTKVDRSGSYMARYVAKNLVAAGLADRLEIQIAYAIGVARPLSVSVEAFGTARVDNELILSLIDRHFDFRPGAIIHRFELRRPIYRQVATFGHFGRSDITLPWEQTDMAEILRKEAFGTP